MKNGYLLIRWTDHSQTNKVVKSNKTLLDLDTAINFFCQPFTINLIDQIVRQLNADWNKSYAKKAVTKFTIYKT